MADHPLNLRDWQVVAAQEGRLSVLVVPMKPQPRVQRFCAECGLNRTEWAACEEAGCGELGPEHAILSTTTLPLIVGDRYWGRETWMPGYHHDPDAADGIPKVSIIYRADKAEATCAAPSYEFAEEWLYAFSEDGGDAPAWRSSVTMRRRFSRITIIPTSVRVASLHELTQDEAIAAGVVKVRDACHVIRGFDYDLAGLCHTSAVTPFAKMWDHQRGRGAWDRNPWVAIATATVHHRNIDTLPTPTSGG